MAGYIKKGLSNEKTKKRVAYHEAGHAVCGWYLKGGDPLVKLTIIPRSKGALGYAQYLPKTAYIRSKSELIDQIAIMLGGTTSEQVFLGGMSSGNSDDLQKVYGLARRMVTQFGMGARTYNLTLDEQTYVKKESEKLCNLMDEEMISLVNEAT
jgi:AFG3 family protein